MYTSQNSRSCQLEGCSISFLKSAGLNIHGKWFCTVEHSELDPETIEMIELIKKHGDMSLEQLEKELS